MVCSYQCIQKEHQYILIKKSDSFPVVLINAMNDKKSEIIIQTDIGISNLMWKAVSKLSDKLPYDSVKATKLVIQYFPFRMQSAFNPIPKAMVHSNVNNCSSITF